ncbi:unnamed protein product [Moneuplotes crassus]|uniref:Uncharacterized protein n=1 Tax=Euplotes crassus TaxID=5936 RepID=A0AAD1U6T6_EUPCR|nr:unnamed protein product [Moneuplotes crassus]
MSTYAKYMDRYKRIRSSSQDPKPDMSFKNASMIDRETYTKFMEQELEKVGAAFLKVKDMPERMEQLQDQIILNQEKINNLSRILNLLQDTENSQENDLRDIKSSLRKLGVTTVAAKDREYTKFKINEPQDSETVDLINRLRKLEDRISMPCNSSPRKISPEKNMSARMSRSLQEMEERLTQMIRDRLPSEKSSRKSTSRSKSPHGNSKTGPSMKLIEKSVNKWTEKVEEQVNIIQNQVDEKASINEVRQAIEKERHERSEVLDRINKLAENSEKVSSRLAEDVYETVDLNNRKLNDFEDRLTHLREWVEDLSQVDARKYAPESPSFAKNPGYMTKSDLMNFEKKLNKKILESLDETNSIMKKIKVQSKELNSRVKALEQKRARSRSKSKKRDPKPYSLKRKVNDNRSLEKVPQKRANPSLTSEITSNDKRGYNSTERSIRNLVTGIEPYKKQADVVRTMAKPNTVYSYVKEDKNVDSSKDTKENEERKTLKRPFDPVVNDSKPFTEFMTFEENNSSELFDLSENESVTKNRLDSKMKNSSRSSSRISRKETPSKENVNPNQIPQKRSRIAEFESLRKKKKSSKGLKNKRSRSSRNSKNSRRSSKRKLSSKKKLKSSSKKLKNSSVKNNLKHRFKDSKIKKKTKPQAKGSNIKLAKLEKMYQELSELESKCCDK